MCGALIGVLSALPIVGWLNTCCCLWVVMGGAMAVWISQSNHPYPVTAADGALVGLLAGVVGGLLGVALFKKKDLPPPPAGTVEILPPQEGF